MLYIWIAVCIAAGAGAVFLAGSAPSRKRFCRAGYGFLAVSAVGLVGLCTGTVLFFLNRTSENDGETLLRMFFSTTAAAAAVCIVIVLGTIFTGKKLIRPVVISVPFLWTVPLLLWTDLCASWTDKPDMILTLGFSLCALLFLCPAAAFLRAAALLKREEAANPHEHKEDTKKEKR
ncbi:MAG: hypothetical protein HFE65_07595 [Clostridiales bacterium]|jgi:hypothetical protein|nr:hypothetical protein [Clostridiales bacterium]